MEIDLDSNKNDSTLEFYGGPLGALFPFFLFVIGVVTIALSGAPDERGFWPVLLLALGISLLLAKDKTAFSNTVIAGMSQPIVMIMITAWILASIIGVLMTATGFVEALTWLAAQLNLQTIGFVLSTFTICCIVSLSTGSSFATILICGPILYPAGGMIGAHLPTLAGAIIGGATFGDFIAPISDTTIASALSQKAKIGPTVRSRLKYIIPAALLAFIGYGISAWLFGNATPITPTQLTGNPRGLPMLLVPAFIIYLFLKGKHLLHGLLLGLMLGVLIGLVFGLLPLEKLLSLDLDNMVAKSFVIDGINRAVGISFFTILLMGLVASLKASGLVHQLVQFAEKHSQTPQHAEAWIAGTVGTAVLFTTHSIVAILMIAEFSNTTGEKMGIAPQRRLFLFCYPILFLLFSWRIPHSLDKILVFPLFRLWK